MSSIKARKGNPFEYNVAYSIMQNKNMSVKRIDDNTSGVDLIAENKVSKETFYIECKFHKGFSWNKLEKIFTKTKEKTKDKATPLLIFKANRQPVCVMYSGYLSNIYTVIKFEDFWDVPFLKRPKGVKIWGK